MAKKASAEATVRNIRRKTRRKYCAEEKIRIVLEARDHSVAELYRREGLGENLYYRWYPRYPYEGHDGLADLKTGPGKCGSINFVPTSPNSLQTDLHPLEHTPGTVRTAKCN